MTDSELIAEIAKTAITPFIIYEELDGDDVWDVDTVFETWWETVYFLFIKPRPEFIKEKMK